MNNKTQIEQAAANLADFNICKTDNWIAGANWQKQQDEAKYKELLDSHNELLEGIKEISEISDGIGVLNQNWLKGFCEELINKAKNIKL